MESFPVEIDEAIQQTAKIMRLKSRGVAFTGAGISTPSGIPDFRSPEHGLWTQYRPMEVASLTAFRSHPDKFYSWLRPLAQKLFSAQPNEAHHALAKLEEKENIQTIITQNIDNLHQKAGSENVLEVHGSLKTLSCTACHQQTQTTEDLIISLIDEGNIPRCRECGAVLKPDVVLFEEQLPVQTWEKAETTTRNSDYMLVVGSSLTVQPVSSLPQKAVASGATLMIINQTETHMDDQAQVLIHGDVANVLPVLTQKVLYG
ncbi:MAG: NAD-dependent deacylase [Anaerolineales bacterium]|nr:NAD-dependent deacylase [Anaerolineales bacterium]